MQILRCALLDYPEGQIYSIDLHPSGKFLATCGCDGKGKGLVTIWSTASFNHDYNGSEAEDLPPEDSLVSTVSAQSASIVPSITEVSKSDVAKYKVGEKTLLSNQNCVRWSKFNGGKWLVAAGDSPTLQMYTPAFNKNSVSLDASVSLMGHTMEIMHAEFSKDGKFLASCSLDNTVIVWDLEDKPKLLVRLDENRGGHTDGVKGLSWDPMEKFLATQSADGSVRLWRCETWDCERIIKGFFDTCSQSSLFSRLDWSADGAFLIATGALNNGFKTAKIIVRKGFNCERDFVGFERHVSCVRSNDRCTLPEDPTTGETKLNLVAIGSEDRSVSVWMLPYVNRPLCVVRNFFPEGLLDLSWNDRVLAAVGVNGCVRVLIFDDSEIGKFLSGRQMCDHFDNLYGCVPSSFKTYLPKLSVEGGATWVEQILKDVFEPSDSLTSQATESHYRLGYHAISPTCTKCCDVYRQTRCKFGEGVPLKTFAEDLYKEITHSKDSSDISDTSVSDLSD